MSNMNSVTLNEVVLSEAIKLNQYCLETYPYYFEEYWQPLGLASYLDEQYSLTRLNNDIKSPTCAYYFIKHEGKTVGFLKINFQPDINTFKDCLELEKIYLLPGENNNGYGGQALRLVEEIAQSRQKKNVALYVLDTNQPGISFYKRHGYVQSGTARLDYAEFKGDRRGLYLMIKKILPNT